MGKISFLLSSGDFLELQGDLELQGKKVLLGVAGGIAAYKSHELVRLLIKVGADVRVVLTQNARHFVSETSLQALCGHSVRCDIFDEHAEAAMGHIELARWADLICIAPATANLMARLATGMADELLTTLCLASSCPIVVAPAMNMHMWAHPATQANVSTLTSFGYHLVGPASGEQACGDIGPGRMIEPSQIFSYLLSIVNSKALGGALRGRTVMITAGPTREAIDPVRYITNHSSGKMGYALAQAALNSGASVILVSGPVALEPPVGATLISVESALDMQRACLSQVEGCDIFIGCAAVADYRAKTLQPQKMKKSGDNNEVIALELVANPDILATVAAMEHPPFCVGFAAETQNVEEYARQKLVAKKLKVIAANHVGIEGQGFNSDDNALIVLSGSRRYEIAKASKSKVANDLMRLIADEYLAGSAEIKNKM